MMSGLSPVDGAEVIKERWAHAVGGVHGSIAISSIVDSVSCAFCVASCMSTKILGE